MSNGSPTAYLLWAILSCIFLSFLFLHLWSYDRFNCLRWDAGRQPGAFKRVMTYSYLATLPLLVVFSVAITVLKFKEGFILQDGYILPRPFELWSARNQSWVLPLYFVLSFAWSLELVTHLEELTFWMFLLNQAPGKREWFGSWEFRTWTIGSAAAITGMPLTVLSTRHNLETCLAYIFLVGSSAGTSTTICFLYILAKFPRFIRHVKAEGAVPDVVVRLTTFYQLNCIRVVFRFLFTLPLMIIALDSLHSPYPIISDPFAMDFLLMMGGIGCFISSAITLLIFFPRSITHESGYQAKAHSPQASKMPTGASSLPHYYHSRHLSSPKSMFGQHSPHEIHMSSFRFPDSPPQHSLDLGHSYSNPPRRRNSGESELSPGYESDAESIGLPSRHPHMPSPPLPSQPIPLPASKSKAPSSDDTIWEREQELSASMRRRHSDGLFFYDHRGRIVTTTGWTPVAQEEGREHPPLLLHPYVINFTSPIDLMDGSQSGRRPAT